jgi:hypothetical protein
MGVCVEFRGIIGTVAWSASSSSVYALVASFLLY